VTAAAPERATTFAYVVDPALALADVICRLRRSGVGVRVDRPSLADAHRHMAAALEALGVSGGVGELADADLLLLRCVAARRP
jgi:hypothetical protein